VYKSAQSQTGGFDGFFRLSFCDETLRNYYVANFALMQHHQYRLDELESMLPWERKIYISLVSRYVQEENEKRKMEQQALSKR